MTKEQYDFLVKEGVAPMKRLSACGVDEEGDQLFIGTKQEWDADDTASDRLFEEAREERG